MIHLRPLPRNGTIGIMAPSSPVDEDKLQVGVRYFEKLGYRIVLAPGCLAHDNYLAGSAGSRAHDLMKLMENPDVDAVFFARGGFGSIAMLPLLDYDLIRSARKLMVGFSDITALQWGIYAKTGLPSLSAGMPAIDFGSDPVHPGFEEQFWKYLQTGRMDYEMEPSSNRQYLSSNRQYSEVRGITLPGTLSVAIRLAGTPFIPDFHQAIPVFEDVAESRHKIEGSLWQAKLAGWFDRCHAVIFGEFSPPGKETFPDNPSLEKIFERIFNDCELPVITGFPYGHIDHKFPVPVGQEISLSLERSVKISSTDTLFEY